MGTRHSLFLISVFISNFMSPLYGDGVPSKYPRLPSYPRPRTYNRCSRVPIPDGTMVLKHRGRVAKFTCNSGFKLIGDNIATCHQRKWDAIPVCVKNVQCPKEIPKVLNGRMVEYLYVYFKVICNEGYKLPDSVHSIYPCEDFFRSDVIPPVCQLSDALYCDFEKDTCGWNSTIPYFSWIRYQNATPSHELRTGPGGDHTTGTGHYLYIEASGLPDHEERYAKLTRFFKQVDTPEVCFVFWYHMYGYSIGTLDVYVDFTKVFSKSGNLGDKWRKGIVQRLPSDRDFYISVMATTGNGFAGDIAIDDIGLVNSTDCTKTILIDKSCRNRCFESEVNPNLCKCSSECLIEGTCCTDFMHICSNDAYTSTVTDETTEWEVTLRGLESSHDEGQSPADSESSTEMYGSSSSEQDTSLYGDWSTDGGLATEQVATASRIQDHLVSGSIGESDPSLVTHDDDSGWWSSTQQEPDHGSSAWPAIQQESHDDSNNRSSTWQHFDVSSTLPSTQQEQHSMSSAWASTHQEPHDASTALGSEPTDSRKPSANPSWTMSTSQSEGTEESLIMSSSKTEPESENHPLSSSESPTEQTTVGTPAKTSSTTSADHSSRFPKRESTSASPMASTPNSYAPSNSSSVASHTHLQDNDYDESDESTRATQQTHLDLETTPSALQTRQPYKWKKTYEPKGRYTFSAVKRENKTTTYVSILIGVAVFLAAVVVAAYIFRRRRAIRFRDATEESDVLYMTSEDILDFNLAHRPQTVGSPGPPNPAPSHQTTRICQSDFPFAGSSRS